MKRLISTLMILVAVALNLPAQNVFISPETGHLIAAVTADQEVGFQNGFSALWQHEQLGLNLVVADDGALTGGGEIANPAGNLNIVDGKLTLTGGQSSDCYIVVSLPKGYRFTGYSITLDNNMNNHTYSRSFETGGVRKTFYETGSDFDYNKAKAKTDEMPRANDTKGYTINRQASSRTDMGNRLYFLLHKDANVNNQFYGVSIRSFVVYFSADAPFDQPLQALPYSQATGVAKSSFMVGKPELGTISPNTKGDATYFSYNYRNVDDLEADNLLYQANAIVGGKASDANITTKTITRTINKDGLDKPQPWFALAKGTTDNDNTYYVETPVTLANASGHEFPTGYRITGAKLEFALGQRENGGNIIGINRHGEIKYLRNDLTTGVENPETGWQLDSRNHRLTLNRNTVYVRGSSSNGYYLSMNGGISSTQDFYLDDQNRLYVTRNGSRYYIHEASLDGQVAVLNTNANYAAQLMQYGGFTPSASGFKAEVYDETGQNVTETATISSTNQNQTITLSGLNNDAVKFRVSGLSDGSQALVRITLTMEHLNPYIHSLDVVGKDADDAGQQALTQNFTADNFSVRGGHFVFNVPSGTAGHTWNFEFDNLTSNYTDATYKSGTYTGATNGNARVAFVESKYFKANEDLYADGYNPNYEPVSDKLQVVEVGTVPFRFNNADQLSNKSRSTVASQFEEYPFSVAKYKEDTGYKDAQGRTIKGEFKQLSLKPGQENMAYLMVSDETRYNIAPTTATQHRYYAHYAMDIELQEKEYELTLNPVKVYDNTFYTTDDGTEKESSMWGIKVSTTEDNGYAHMSDVMSKITDLCAKKQNGLEDVKQVLYVDMSSLQSLVLPSGVIRADYLALMRSAMAPNCLIYLPNSMADKADNYANRPEKNGSFSANANIVLTDKTPFFAPYDINVPAESYASYTRKVTHSSTGKSNITTLVLPFQFGISQADGTHTNDNAESRAGDGKTFTVSRLAATDAISADKGNTLGNFNNSMISYDNYVHFDVCKPSTGKSEAYKPYLIYIDDDNQLADDENFSVLEYGANVVATPTETTTGKIKIADENGKTTGTLNDKSFTLTPSATMAGCKMDKQNNPCLYFSADRFRSSWTLTEQYNYVYIFPFRSWFDYEGATSARNTYFGVAFGHSGETTGIVDVEAEKAGKSGKYKFMSNGQLYIRTDKGVFTVDGRKVNL